MFDLLKINVKNDVSAINPLQTIARCIGILPPIDLNDLSHFRTRRWLPISMLLIFATLCVLTTIGKVNNLYETVGVTLQITDLSVDLSVSLSNAVCFIWLNLRKGRRVHGMLVRLRQIDDQFRWFKSESKYGNCKFCFELVLVHVVFLLIWWMNFYLWLMCMGFSVYKHFILRDVQHYCMIVQVMLARHYALLIKYRYELLNRGLASVHLTPAMVHSVGIAYNKWTAAKASGIFSALGEIVDEYNEIFGWQYITMYINILAIILLPINLGLNYGDGQRAMAGVRLGPKLVILCVTYTCFPILLALGVFSGGGVAAEAGKTSTIAFDVLQRLPSSGKFSLARSDLQNFALRAWAKCPELTAAGFFSINYKTLFSLFGSVTSYVIVLMQYKK